MGERASLHFETQRHFSAGRIEKPIKEEALNERRVGSIIISGPGGSGTSEGSRQLAELLRQNGVSVRGIHHVGEITRKRYKKATGKDIIGAYDRDPKIDRRVDARTRELVRNADPDNLIIIEGQNAAVNAHIAEFRAREAGDRIAPPASFLFVCDPLVAGRRVWNRERAKNPRFRKSVLGVVKETQERHAKDLSYWWDSVPFLGANKTDPHNPRDPNARELYSSILDTTFAPPEFIAMQMYIHLVENGMVVPKEMSNNSLKSWE